jgi:hypothetical protein
MFWSKKKPTIEFWPTVRGLETITPIVPAKRILPKWIKDSDDDVKYIDNIPVTQGNIKKCPAVVDFLTEGWVLPMWTDLYINCSETNIEWKASDDSFKFDVHPHSQFIDIMPKHLRGKYFWVFKAYSPWLVKTTSGYNIFSLNPFYHFNQNFDTAEGIQYSDVYYDTNPIILIKRLGEFVIPRGTPLAIYYPYKREKIDCKIFPYNEKTKDLLTKKCLITNTMFSSSKSYNTIKNSACPFAGK